MKIPISQIRVYSNGIPTLKTADKLIFTQNNAGKVQIGQIACIFH